MHTTLLGCAHCFTKPIRTFAGRQVLGKTGVIRTAMPPVPEDRHGYSRRFLQGDRGRQHARRAATIPLPQPVSITQAGIEPRRKRLCSTHHCCRAHAR